MVIDKIDRLQEIIQWLYMSWDDCHKLATKEADKYYFALIKKLW